MTAPRHSAHDFGLLMQRWQRLMTRAKLAGVPLGEANELPIWGLETAAAAAGEPAIYISTGVHGDEPAGPWGLLQWVEKNAAAIKKGSFIFVPCFNPAGFTLNTRADHTGADLNRQFHDDSLPLVATWQSWLRDRSLRVGICLHEDYDALGCYVYELSGKKKAVSESILRACHPIMQRDKRTNIDGNLAARGILHRDRIPKHIQGPEAIVLRELGCPLTLTFETASEWDITTRIATQVKFVESAVEIAQTL